jgi:hypothetical protein
LCLCSWQDVLLTFQCCVSEGKGCAPVTHFMPGVLLASRGNNISTYAQFWGHPFTDQLFPCPNSWASTC